MTPRAHAAALEMEQQRLPDWKLAYRMPEAAAATGLGESTLWKRIAEGKLVAKKDGNATLIERVELQRFIGGLPLVPASKVLS
jgi:excisionase family DNA binding protein